MDHDIAGVAFRASGMRAPISGGRYANGVELTRLCSRAAVLALRGVDVPGLGVVLDVGAPRHDLLAVGARINLITAAG